MGTHGQIGRWVGFWGFDILSILFCIKLDLKSLHSLSKMTTTVLDLPLECIPYPLVAQFATLNKELHEKARKEYLTRNIGKEMFLYFNDLTGNKLNRVMTLTNADAWGMMKYAMKLVHRPTPFWNVFIVPTFSPIRLHTQSVFLDAERDIMMQTESTLDILKLVPWITQGLNTLCLTIEEAIYKFHTLIHDRVMNIIPFASDEPDKIAVDWTTSYMPFYMINTREEHIYTLPATMFTKDMTGDILQEGSVATFSNELLPYILNFVLDCHIVTYNQ